MYTQLKRAIRSSGSKHWYISVTKENFGDDIEYRTMKNLPAKTEYSDIRYLSFAWHPRNEAERKFIPHFIADLPDLKSLKLPIDWLNKINVPPNLQVLLLTAPVGTYDTSLSFPSDLHFDSLKYLAVPELVKPYKIDLAKFNSLEWIEYDLQAEKKENVLAELAGLKNLKHLIFNHAKNFDVFRPFQEHAIETLELFACTGKTFPADRVVQLKKLKSIYINNIAVPFDCSWLLELPDLKEVNFLNLKKITNVPEILKHPAIDMLNIKFCNDPFKGIPKENFLRRGFKELEIRFA